MYMYDVYDVYIYVYAYDGNRRYSNATNTPTSDIMKEMVPYLPHRIDDIDHHQCAWCTGRGGAAARQ